MTKDPVCGMSIEEAKAAAKAVYQGTTYHFCSAHCHKKFQATPGMYAKPASDPKRGS